MDGGGDGHGDSPVDAIVGGGVGGGVGCKSELSVTVISILLVGALVAAIIV